MIAPAAFLLATPIFGLTLAIDPSLDLPALLAIEVAPFTEAALEMPPPPETDVTVGVMQRARLAPIHEWLGIATWASMTVTMALTTITYRDRYGGFDARDRTPCARGDALFGPRQCFGAPNAQLTSSLMTTALYVSTSTLSFLLPDPIGLDRGHGRRATRLRMHKRLRWVHTAAMVSRFLFGFLAARPRILGLDREDDFRTIRGLATAELAFGLVAYGTLTWAGSLMIRR